MSHAIDSKSAAAVLIDPIHAPEPSAADGPGGSGFGSTFAGVSNPQSSSAMSPQSTGASSNNPYRKASIKQSSPPAMKPSSPPMHKTNASVAVRSSSGSPRSRERFPNYRAEAFATFDDAPPSRSRASSHGTPPSYQEATAGSNSPVQNRPRRGSSLKERYPGDESGEPLSIIRRDSRKAYRSHHLHKRSIPGADSIDRLDPAVGGRAYHHEGPYDAALLSRNRNPKYAPLEAVKDSNAEALRATPKENIKDAVDHHRPLDGVAVVPPGQADRFGRRYDYQEGSDMMHEPSSGDAGYKRWANKDYDPDDLKGEGDTFALDRALRTHNIRDDNHAVRQDGSIELQDRSRLSRDYHDQQRAGTLDTRDPVDIAGGESRYVDMEIAASSSESHVKRNTLGGSLKKRIGSLRRKDREE